MKPRFTVGTVTGWPTTNTGRSRHAPTTIAYVFDSAYCYLPVAEFRGLQPGRVTPAESAQALADQLNKEHA